MSYWLVDRMLPGLVSSAVWAGVLWLSHRRLRRHIDTVTRQQTAELQGTREEAGGP